MAEFAYVHQFGSVTKLMIDSIIIGIVLGALPAVFKSSFLLALLFTGRFKQDVPCPTVKETDTIFEFSRANVLSLRRVVEK